VLVLAEDGEVEWGGKIYFPADGEVLISLIPFKTTQIIDFPAGGFTKKSKKLEMEKMGSLSFTPFLFLEAKRGNNNEGERERAAPVLIHGYHLEHDGQVQFGEAHFPPLHPGPVQPDV